MSEVYVGNIDPILSTLDIQREFQPYGEILAVKFPRTFTGNRRYAFVEFKDRRDALFAIHSWNKKYAWRVQLSRNSNWVSASSFVPGNNNCFTCGGSGHFARDCTSTNRKDIKNKSVKKSQKGGMKKNRIASTSIWKPVPPPPPPWQELPDDITARILHKLGLVGLLYIAQNVCTTWRRVCRDPTMWRVIDMWKLGCVEEIYELPFDGFEDLCRLAVDLSQGEATEINIEDFLSDELLEYIAERCGKLRCLRLASCDDVSGETLCKAVKEFPLLEEVHLQCMPFERDEIEAIGRSCPMLKKFALNGRVCRSGVLKSSEDALAVAKSMPELRHLQLFGNRMTNEGLEAILNGCPKLESLDLRQCFNIDLEGELGKRCAQQIKNLRRPHDSTDDYEWDAKPIDWGHYSHGYFSDDISDHIDFDDDIDFDNLDYDDFYLPYPFDGGGDGFFLEEHFDLY